MDEKLKKIKQKKIEEIMKKAEQPKGVAELTGEYFYTFTKENKIAVVDCWAPWCGPCQMIAPVIEELAKKYQGKIAFGKLNADDNQGILMEYGVQGIPTLLIFKNGSLVDRNVGAVGASAIEAKLMPYLEEGES